MRWDEVEEIAPLYVIGALDEKTAHDLEASLHSAAPQQRRVITHWREVANLVPQALPLQTPPDYVRERLLNRIVEETQQSPIEIAVEESSSEDVTKQDEAMVLPFVQPRRSEPRAARLLLIAAAALLFFAAGYLFKEATDLTDERNTLARERDDLAKEMAKRGRQIEDMVSPSTRVIAMVGDQVPQANAKVFWDTKAQQWAVYIFNLPAPPSEKEYQLWYVTKNAKISAAVFRTDSLGRTVLKLALPPAATSGMAATAVTLEPRGGSPQPTGKFYLKASI